MQTANRLTMMRVLLEFLFDFKDQGKSKIKKILITAAQKYMNLPFSWRTLFHFFSIGSVGFSLTFRRLFTDQTVPISTSEFRRGIITGLSIAKRAKPSKQFNSDFEIHRSKLSPYHLCRLLRLTLFLGTYFMHLLRLHDARFTH